MPIEVPEVMQAADALEARLQPHVDHQPEPSWTTVGNRLDDVMRNDLHRMFGVII